MAYGFNFREDESAEQAAGHAEYQDHNRISCGP